MASPLPEERLQARQPRRFLVPLLFAVFVRALPLTMVGPLLAGIARSLGAGLAEAGWIVATYATGSLVAQPIMGRFSDARGRRITLWWCLALFGAGSAICALSTSLAMLVVGRIVAALGAGGVAPIASAVIGDRLPESRRGGPLGALYAMFGLGTMAGAVAGGGIVALSRWSAAHLDLGTFLHRELAIFPWHAVFWFNVALAAIALVFVGQMPADEEASQQWRGVRIDGVGIAFVVLFAACAMAATMSGAGFALLCVAGAILSVAGLVLWERHAAAPLFSPEAFAGRGPLLIYAVAALYGWPSFSLTIYSATYFVARFNAGELQSGLALFGLAVLYVVGAVAGGRLVRATGAKPPLLAGIVVTAIALFALAVVGSPQGAAVAMALGGAGLGLASAPPNALILAYVAKARSGVATGVATMLATSGSITAPAIISAFLHFSKAGAARAMDAEFIAGGLACLVCAALSAALPSRRTAQTFEVRSAHA